VTADAQAVTSNRAADLLEKHAEEAEDRAAR
jgi:hypothetical protein